jgi:peptide/nickel transport system substrate-binding protein
LNAIYQKKMVDEAVRWTALLAGDIDMVDVPPLNVLAKAVLEKPVPGVLMDHDSMGNGWIWFNMSKPPFDNKKVRQAVAYGLHKETVLKAIYWGLGEIENNQPFLKNSRFYVPVMDREFDVAKAKQLLAEAGYPNGFKTEFLTYSTTYDVAGCEATVGQLKKIGIDATIKVVDRTPYYSMMRKGEYFASYRGDSERFDWDDAYYMYLHSSEIDKNNWSRYASKEMDALLEKGRTTMNWKDRAGIYAKVVETIKEDLPILYVCKNVIGLALKDYVKGYRKGFSMRFAWHDGGAKFWWIDK